MAGGGACEDDFIACGHFLLVTSTWARNTPALISPTFLISHLAPLSSPPLPLPPITLPSRGSPRQLEVSDTQARLPVPERQERRSSNENTG